MGPPNEAVGEPTCEASATSPVPDWRIFVIHVQGSRLVRPSGALRAPLGPC